MDVHRMHSLQAGLWVCVLKDRGGFQGKKWVYQNQLCLHYSCKINLPPPKKSSLFLGLGCIGQVFRWCLPINVSRRLKTVHRFYSSLFRAIALIYTRIRNIVKCRKACQLNGINNRVGLSPKPKFLSGTPEAVKSTSDQSKTATIFSCRATRNGA